MIPTEQLNRATDSTRPKFSDMRYWRGFMADVDAELAAPKEPTDRRAVESVGGLIEHLLKLIAGERLAILNKYGVVGRVTDKQILGCDNCLLWMADELARLREELET